MVRGLANCGLIGLVFQAGPGETELLAPEETFNPIAQHLQDCVRARAARVPATVGGVVDPAAVALLPPTSDGRPPMTLVCKVSSDVWSSWFCVCVGRGSPTADHEQGSSLCA